MSWAYINVRGRARPGRWGTWVSTAPNRLLTYDLRAEAGVVLTPLTLPEFCGRFAEEALTAPFHAVVLGDLQPQGEQNLVQGYTERSEWAVWRVDVGPEGAVGSLLVFSMTSSTPLVHVLGPERGAAALPAFYTEGLLILVEAALRYHPNDDWILTALNAPPSAEAEDALLALGFEPFTSFFDELGRVTFGVHRSVFAATWQAFRS